MSGAYETPSQKCPYCGYLCDADWCDVGVGMVQCGPYYCEGCRASEIGPHDNPRELTSREVDTGWYATESDLGSSANVINGKPVPHKEMMSAYKEEFTGNPLHSIPGVVDSWFEDIRKPVAKQID